MREKGFSTLPSTLNESSKTITTMKQFVAIVMFALGFSMTANAQTFLEHVKQQKTGEGKVTVSQSQAIDELVNGQKPAAPATTPVTGTGNTETRQTATETTTHYTPSGTTTESETRRTETETRRTETETRRPDISSSSSTNEDESETTTVDMRKKVMRNSYKVTGYRVQAFAGGNSRADKQKAEQAGRDIKMRYPELPVYVHFYSPQWKCRVGNFRSLAEANKVLKNIRAMGYKQACVVKGKISVQY